MQTWSREEQLRHLISLPWTISLTVEDGDQVARVAEMPGIVGVGASPREVQADLYEAISLALEVALEHGDPIRTPFGRSLPWQQGEEPQRRASRRLALDGDVSEGIRATATGSLHRMAMSAP